MQSPFSHDLEPRGATMPAMIRALLNSRPARIVSWPTLLLLMTGCQGFIYGQTGDTMSNYTVDHMVPHLMSDGDVNMACETGVSMGAFLISFGRVTDAPDKAGLVTMMSGGMCAEGDAWEAELRGIRAMHAELAAEAQDARISEKRAHLSAARRFGASWDMSNNAFGELGGPCEALDLEEEDQLLYLMGLSGGLLAVVHDRPTGGLAGIGLDIPPAVGRAAKCLAPTAFGSAPKALEATIWVSVPGAAPDGVDPWAILEEAATEGQAQGLRLARAFQVQAAAASGRDDVLRAAIAAHAESLATTPSHPDYKLLDNYATLIIQHESDKIWTRDTGHRTPVGELGTFYEAEPESEVDDSLLEDL